MFFKLVLFVCVLFLSSSPLISQDLLAKRIMIYNKIEEPRLELDSSKLFYNLKFTSENKDSVNRNIEIIQHRKNTTKSTSFFWLLLFLFIFSMVRYASGKKYSDLISGFFSFRITNLNSYGFLKSTLVTIAFIVLLSYSIARLLDEHFKINTMDRNLIFIIFSIVSILVFRFVIYRLVVYIFNLKNNISNFQFVVFV